MVGCIEYCLKKEQEGRNDEIDDCLKKKKFKQTERRNRETKYCLKKEGRAQWRY